MAAENNVITTDSLKRVREVDFIDQFTHGSLNKLIDVLGQVRKIPLVEGTTMYVYKMDGTLEDGNVAEGDIIPLSQITQTKEPVGEITLKKWRKATTAESILKFGRNQAVVDTDNKLLKLAQKDIRTNLFGFLNGPISSSSTATGANIQEAFADAWGQLEVKFEDDVASPVYFVNPLDIADYLKTAQITTQTVFGLSYVEDFLGLGTVILSGGITKGTFTATAKENIIMYYINMAGGDLANSFDMSTDPELGLVGITSGYQNQERAQIETLVMSGINFMVEYAEGVVKGTIAGE